MCRSCRYCIIVELAIILGLLNSSVTMATETTEVSVCPEVNPCTEGEFFDKNNCLCKNCPKGTFNKEKVHRNNNCTDFKSSPHPNCTLTKNGTNLSVNEWNCSMIESVILSNVTMSTPTMYSSTIPPTSEKTLVIVIISSTFCVCVVLVIIILCCIRKRKQNPPQQTADPEAIEKMISSKDCQENLELKNFRRELTVPVQSHPIEISCIWHCCSCLVVSQCLTKDELSGENQTKSYQQEDRVNTEKMKRIQEEYQTLTAP